TAPDYLWTFLWRQNVGRFVAGDGGAGHPEPIWFYLWILPVVFLPWSLFAPGAVRRAVVRARRGDDLWTLLLLWIAVVFVFFSVSRAKLATYMLPMFPALALVVGDYVVHTWRAPASAQRAAFRIPGILWAVLVVASTLGAVIAVAVRYPPYARSAFPALVLLVFPFALLVALRRARWAAIPSIVVLGTFATHLLFYRAGSPVVN